MSYTKTSNSGIQWFSIEFCDDPNMPLNSVMPRRVVYTCSKTGEYSPNWRSLIQNGSDATTPFDATRSKVVILSRSKYLAIWQRLVSGNVVGESRRTYDGYDYIIGPPNISTGNLQTAAENQAKSELYKKLRKAKSPFGGVEFFGDIRDTLNMIANPAKALRTAMTTYLSHVKKHARKSQSHRKLRKAIADTYLEYAFGWSPLVNDTIGAMHALADILEKIKHTHVRSVGTARSSWIDMVNLPQAVGSGDFKYLLSSRQFAEVKCIYRASLWDSLEYSVSRAALERFGFQWSAFVPDLWELLPWSFVVDYFANVGDILQSVFTDVNTIRWVNRTFITKKVRSVVAVFDEKQTRNSITGARRVVTLTGSTGEAKYETYSVSRRSISPSDLSIVRTEFSLPGLSTQWINLAALLSQASDIATQRFRH